MESSDLADLKTSGSEKREKKFFRVLIDGKVWWKAFGELWVMLWLAFRMVENVGIMEFLMKFEEILTFHDYAQRSI